MLLAGVFSAPVILLSSILLSSSGSHAGLPLELLASQVPSATSASQLIDHSRVKVPVTITVQPGQTLSGISGTYYGTPRYWPFLAEVNHLAAPDRIWSGERLLIPAVPQYVKPPTLVVASARTSNPQSISVGGSASRFPAYGVYSYSMLEAIWEWAGGPAWAAPQAATIAGCESGGRTWAVNPYSGAAGLWQIKGAPANWTGSLDWLDARVNAQAAVAKFTWSHDTFSQWVCQ